MKIAIIDAVYPAQSNAMLLAQLNNEVAIAKPAGIASEAWQFTSPSRSYLMLQEPPSAS